MDISVIHSILEYMDERPASTFFLRRTLPVAVGSSFAKGVKVVRSAWIEILSL